MTVLKNKTQQILHPQQVGQYNPSFNEGGFIDLHDLLNRVDQFKCWQHILNQYVNEETKFRNPFREDKRGDCYLQYSYGMLCLTDYANKEFNGMSLIEATKRKFGLSFKQALIKLSEISNITPIYNVNPNSTIKLSYSKFDFKLKPVPHTNTMGDSIFLQRDAEFWSKRYISSEDLIEDDVISVKSYYYNTRKTPNNFYIRHLGNTRCYGYKINDKFKLYMPDAKEFVSTLGINDVGGIIKSKGNTLFITKSYKDYRVIKNSGCECVWFQSEAMIPEEYILADYILRYKTIIVLYDNDEAGIRGSKILSETLNTLADKTISTTAFVPIIGGKDPDDFIVKFGKNELKLLLNQIADEHKRIISRSRNT